MRAARVLLLALLVGCICPVFAEVAVPPLTGRVVDQTGTLSSGDIAALTQKLTDLETRKGSQVAVLIVPTTAEETIEQFSIRVADAWKIGRRKIDDGALLLIAKNDRHLRIEVGYGLEGVLTDATTRRIIDEDMTPKFKVGDFAGGVSAGLDRMIRLIDGEKLPASEPEHWQAPSFLNQIDPLFLLVGIFVLGAFLRATLGRLIGAAATGGIVGFFVWAVAGSIAAAVPLAIVAFIVTMIAGAWSSGTPGVGHRRYRRSDGWSGGAWPSGSDWSSGSSGGSGGFSGGGGGFGGGGASGSW